MPGIALVAWLSAAPALAQTGERADVEIRAVSGEISFDEARALEPRWELLLARCAERGRAARGQGELVVRLRFDARGRSTGMDFVVPPTSPAVVGYFTCATPHLGSSWIRTRGAATVELALGWRLEGETAPAPRRPVRVVPAPAPPQPPARVRPSPPLADAPVGISYDAVTRLVRARIDHIALCCDQEFDDDPDGGGRVDLRISVAADGRVSDVAVADNPSGSARLATCLVGVVRQWSFPPPGQAAAITYPFDFRSDEAADVRPPP